MTAELRAEAEAMIAKARAYEANCQRELDEADAKVKACECTLRASRALDVWCKANSSRRALEELLKQEAA